MGPKRMGCDHYPKHIHQTAATSLSWHLVAPVWQHDRAWSWCKHVAPFPLPHDSLLWTGLTLMPGSVLALQAWQLVLNPKPKISNQCAFRIYTNNINRIIIEEIRAEFKVGKNVRDQSDPPTRALVNGYQVIEQGRTIYLHTWLTFIKSISWIMSLIHIVKQKDGYSLVIIKESLIHKLIVRLIVFIFHPIKNSFRSA